MMPTVKRQPNLLPRRSTRRWGMLAALIGVPIISAVFLAESFSGGRTATITHDATPTPSSSGAPASAPPVSTLSPTAATGLARGISRDTVRWFDESTGKAYEGNLKTGALRTMSDVAVEGFVEGYWIPGKEQAIVVADNARTGKTFTFVDFVSGSRNTFGDGTTHVSVSPDGKRIAVAGPGTEGSVALSVADPDGGGARIVLSTRLHIARLDWHGSQALLLTTWKSNATTNDLISLSLDGSIRTLLIGKGHLELRVSASGDVLASFDDHNAGVVGLFDPSTPKERYLISRTSAGKCGWAPQGPTLLCAVPNEPMSSGSSMTASQDRFVLIDADSGIATSAVPTSKDRVSALFPVLSSSGSFAAYIDLFDRRVHVLEL